ncbi:hypothetical protein RHMOL_Rhmol01G0377100 [Rhododendron molle]|uniref:Uncharacterized protein n=1 Tax=Rhododendron molle TaxID=49168 RepID=A0ACC0QB89_RHOML|nr:hypothetical protein RHMOL_Rhmol01G0377100 [Rhododendron molle]
MSANQGFRVGLPQVKRRTLLLSDSDDEENDDTKNNNNKTQLAKEESKLEKAIIRTILSGKTDTLKPNSGQAVTVNEHHICVGFHRDAGSEYRVWEWHGHVMLFDEENGYSPAAAAATPTDLDIDTVLSNTISREKPTT